VHHFNIIFFFFNRRCKLCGFWPHQLSLSILSRKVLTERHVKPPNLEDQCLERSNSRHQVSPRLKRHERTSVAEGGTMGEKLPRILPKVATSRSFLGSFTCREFTTWDRRLHFPSEGRRAEDFFFARKIRRLRPGWNPRTWVLKASTLIFNRLTPNDPYIGRIAPLTSRCCILYIYSTNIRTEYFKHAA